MSEAAELLGVTRQTLAKWAQAGLIPHRKIPHGRRTTYLFRRETLLRWLDGEGEDRAVDPSESEA